MREFGLNPPDDVEVRVHDSTADIRYLVLPLRPKGTESWSEADLAKLVTRDSMIGVMDPLDTIPEIAPNTSTRNSPQLSFVVRGMCPLR